MNEPVCSVIGCDQPKIHYSYGFHSKCLEHKRMAARASDRLYRQTAKGGEQHRLFSRRWASKPENRSARHAYLSSYRSSDHGRERDTAHHSALRARRAGVILIIKVELDHCGVCLLPLLPVLGGREPMSTTIGHEPPFARARRDGWQVIVERPEHWSCNLRKGQNLDFELKHEWQAAGPVR